MENEIRDFILYLHEEKKTSVNTELSYKRDLQKLQSFLSGQGIEDVGRITETSLNSVSYTHLDVYKRQDLSG